MSKTSDQFKVVKFQGQSAIEGFSAVLDADGVHVALVAPTLDALDEVWQRFHVLPVDRERAQKVLIFRASGVPAPQPEEKKSKIEED